MKIVSITQSNRLVAKFLPYNLSLPQPINSGKYEYGLCPLFKLQSKSDMLSLTMTIIKKKCLSFYYE